MIANTDGDDPRLDELLMRWEELQEQGQSLSAEELCSTCPELAGELARRIALLRKMDPLLVETNTAPGDPAPATPASGSCRESATARADFRDLRFHKAGALGEVFMAKNAELNREVALKFLKPERLRDPDSVRRFHQEAEVTGRLEHPGVVPIYALGTDASGAPCYAMRFIKGETLQDPIGAFHAAEKSGRDPSERSLALRELLNRFVSICSTMAYAHNRGILHRDLKPQNVMLGKYDETLVVDWGLAKKFDRDEAARLMGEETLTPSSGSGSGSDTPTGMAGTPAYMSPEQAEAKWEIVGPASDIFALGAILYAILTGRPPYQDRTIGQVLEKVKRCEFTAPRQVKPGVSRALEAVCLKAMAMKPEDRYATALDLAADVRRWLADEPVSAYAEPVAACARRWMRRHRTITTTSISAMLITLVLVAIAYRREANLNTQLDRAVVELTWSNTREHEARTESGHRLEQTLQVVGVFNKYSQLMTIRNNTAALEAFNDAVRVQKAIIRGSPKVMAPRELLVTLLINQGNAYAANSRPVDAERALREAIKMAQGMREEYPAVSRCEELTAAALLNLALTIKHDEARAVEVRDILDQAIAMQEKLFVMSPEVPEYRSVLAQMCDHKANFLRAQLALDEAEALYRKELSYMSQLAAEQPQSIGYHFGHGQALHNLADLLRERGHPKEGLPLEREAVRQLESLYRSDVKNPYYRQAFSYACWTLTSILVDLKDHRAATQAVTDYLRIEPNGFEESFEATGFLCLCVSLCREDTKLPTAEREVLARTYADRALAALSTAVRKGFRDVKLLESSRIYGPIRTRDEFRRLVRKLEEFHRLVGELEVMTGSQDNSP